MTALHMNTAGARALPIDLLLASIPSLPRAALNQLVDRAIEQMDADDGDTDLEDDDPAGTFEDMGEGGTTPEWSLDWDSAAYPDDDCEEDDADRRTRRPHMERIRLTRCDRTVKPWGGVQYRLRNSDLSPANLSKP
jgi:hypothetical protein